jgi:putative Mn2+ efflux pump MntP
MNFFEIILIGLALSMDACALTIANCTTYSDSLNKKNEWSMPIAFAVFQGVMPLIGFFIGSAFSGFIGTIADYLTAAIFFFLSGKIVFDIIKEKKEEKYCPVNSGDKCTTAKFTFSALILQAVATSIDALAVGVTLINLSFSVYLAVLAIAAVTFVLVAAALIFGKSLGKLFGTYAEWFGAAIIFILAIKSLVQAII